LKDKEEMQEEEVIIEQGAVTSVTLPDGIKLIIKDYDVQDEDRFDVHRDEEGDYYQLMEFTENV